MANKLTRNTVIERCFGVGNLSNIILGQKSKKTVMLLTEWSHIDVKKKEKLAYSKSVVLSPDYSEILSISPINLGNNANFLWNIEYANKFRALCAEIKPDNSGTGAGKATSPNPGTYVTIWENGAKIKTIKLPNDSKCETRSSGDEVSNKDGASFGKVLSFRSNSDCPFGAAQWSPNGKKILFMAESSSSSKSENELQEKTFLWQDKWGELLTEIINPIICVLDIDSEKITQIPSEILKSNSLCCGQATWGPDSDSIVFVGHCLPPYKLGLVYCLQRPSRLFLWSLSSGNISALSSPRHSVRSPRFSPDGNHLVWLDIFIGGPHLQCQRLLYTSWSQIQSQRTEDDLSHVKELIPLVDYPSKNQCKFPGLFCPSGLPTNCWTSDSRYLCFSSYAGFSNVPLIIDVSNCLKNYQDNDNNMKPTTLTCPTFLPSVFGDEKCCWFSENHYPQEVSILEVTSDNTILARVSACAIPGFVAILPLAGVANCEQSTIKTLHWKVLKLDSEEVLQSPIKPSLFGLKGIASHVITHEGQCDQNDIYEVKTFQSWLLYPKDACDSNFITTKSLKGLVMIIHGGPHSAFISRWYPSVASFLAEGFGCLFVNYRGSIGYGDAALHSLLGKIGSYDVKDCVQAGDEALKFLGKNIPIAIYGGSHGGFLTCHLAARFGASKYKVAIARNPVTDLISMSLSSDICDWAFVEAGVAQLESSQGRCETAGEGPPPRGQEWYMGQVAKSPQTLKLLAEASPISYVNDSWDLPIYFFLGVNDLRVPMFQGEAFFKRVKACTVKSKVDCQAIIYPKDNHPLDSVPAQIDSCSRILEILDVKLV